MDRNRLFTPLLVAISLATSGVAQTTVTLDFKVGNTSRNAVVHIPSGTNKPAVVFFVHGYGGDGAGFANDTKGDAVADTAKFIAIYPSALNKSWSMMDTADYPFLMALLDTVDARYKVDRNRVYCAGFSQGGFMSFGVGYKHSETFAAVAPVSGHIPSFSTSAPLKRPVPMLMTFGTNDIGANGGADMSSFMADVNTWMKLDSCNPNTKKRVYPYPASNPKSTVARISYTCAQGSELVIDSVVGGWHEWAMDAVNKVNTTVEVWNFFKRFSLAGTTSVLPKSAARSATPSFATFHNGRVFLHGVESLQAVRISDIQGRAISTGSVVDHSFEFASKHQGTYLITGTTASGPTTIKFTTP